MKATIQVDNGAVLAFKDWEEMARCLQDLSALREGDPATFSFPGEATVGGQAVILKETLDAPGRRTAVYRLKSGETEKVEAPGEFEEI